MFLLNFRSHPALVPVGPKPRYLFCWAVIQKKSQSERSRASHTLYYIQNSQISKNKIGKSPFGVYNTLLDNQITIESFGMLP